MIVGISGHKQSGKDTVALIWQLLSFEGSPEYKLVVGSKYIDDVDFVKACLLGQENYGPYFHYFRWEKKSFAHTLKKIVSILTGCKLKNLELESFKRTIVPYFITKSPLDISTYRDLLQKLGTEVFRNHFSDSIWVDSLFKDYTEDCQWLVTDVRFTNEADEINARNGVLIRIQSDRTSTDTHTSETALDSYPWFDYVIDNNGTLEELIVKVRTIMRMEGIL